MPRQAVLSAESAERIANHLAHAWDAVLPDQDHADSIVRDCAMLCELADIEPVEFLRQVEAGEAEAATHAVSIARPSRACA